MLRLLTDMNQTPIRLTFSFFTLAIALNTLFLLYSCQDEDIRPASGTQQAPIKIWLTDDPGDYQQVNIDLLQLQAKVLDDSTGESIWYDLATQAGTYDLLQLQNGLDTLVVNDSLPPGELKEIRLVLGEQNTIMVDSVLQPLKVPSGSTSGFKIKLNQMLIRDSLSQITIDFDAGESIVARGNSSYLLKPVIRVQP